MTNLDAELHNADWSKTRRLDLPDLLAADDVEELRQRLRAEGVTVEHFKTLPVYLENVEDTPVLQEL